MSPVNIFCTTGVAALFLAHFCECSSYEEHGLGSKFSSIHKEHMNDQKGFDIAVHGVLLWASMGFLMPVGILAVRMSSIVDFHLHRHKILVYVHAVLQVMSVVLVTAGAVLSIRKFENAFNNAHQRMGLALYGAIYLQLLVGLKRPKRGARVRTAWFFLHWTLGTATSLVGILNIYTGLHAFHERTSRSTTLWTVMFTAQVCFMTVLYLFQDKWEYIQKQGVLVSADGNLNDASCTTQVDSPIKDVLNEASRKSNALGTYFSRTNVLNKLFQQA